MKSLYKSSDYGSNWAKTSIPRGDTRFHYLSLAVPAFLKMVSSHFLNSCRVEADRYLGCKMMLKKIIAVSVSVSMLFSLSAYSAQQSPADGYSSDGYSGEVHTASSSSTNLRRKIVNYLGRESDSAYQTGKILVTRTAPLWEGESGRLELQVQKHNVVMVEYRVKF